MPQIQSGKLKAFYPNAGSYFPAVLIGTRFHPIPDTGTSKTGWLISFTSYDVIEYGNFRIIVDVTPEKRYAVWSHNLQRFLYTNNDAGFTSKGVAESFIGDHQKCYVVEWEIKSGN